MQKGSDGMMDHCLPQTHVHGDDHHLHNRHDNDNGDYYGCTMVRSWIRRGKRQRAVPVVVDEEQMEPVGLIEGRLAGFADVGADI